MNDTKDVIAFIPLRSGSKGIKNKNIKEIAGKRLYAWTVDELLRSEKISRIVISTDSDEYIDIIQSEYPMVECVKRSKESASDEASTEMAVLEYLKNANISVSEVYLLLCQVTSPLIKVEYIEGIINLVRNSGRSALTVVNLSSKYFWDTTGNPVNYSPLHRPRRQDHSGLRPFLVENGMMYCNTIESWKRTECRVETPCRLYPMGLETLMEIDNPEDWDYIERLLVENVINTRLNKIAKLEQNWDGYDASPIPEKVVDNARKLVGSIKKIFTPEIFPTGAKSIQFDFDHKNKTLEVEIFKKSIVVDLLDDLEVLDHWELGLDEMEKLNHCIAQLYGGEDD